MAMLNSQMVLGWNSGAWIWDLLVGGFSPYPSEKWWSESQLGLLFPRWRENHKMPWFQTTNQFIMDVSMDWFKVFLEHLQYPKEFPAITSSPNHWLTDGVCERITSRHGHYTHCKNIVFLRPYWWTRSKIPWVNIGSMHFWGYNWAIFWALVTSKTQQGDKEPTWKASPKLSLAPGIQLKFQIIIQIYSMKFASWSMKSCFVGSTSDNFLVVLLWFLMVWYQQKLRLANTARFLSLSRLSPSMSLWKITIL